MVSTTPDIHFLFKLNCWLWKGSLTKVKLRMLCWYSNWQLLGFALSLLCSTI